jgi:tRNA(adenine34) deaminase
MKQLTHEHFMKLALAEARKAEQLDEVPIGAVIVSDGRVIARGHNKRETTNDPTGHAEIIALRKAAKKLGSWRMPNARIYVTIEPCSMCAGAIVWARLDEVVFGATDPKGGALGSSYNLYEQKNLNHYPKVTSGILSQECKAILSGYFKKKRDQK